MPKLKVIDLTKPITPRDWETQLARWMDDMSTLTRGAFHPTRLSPPLGGKDGRTRLPSGLPDFSYVWAGSPGVIEAKLGSGTALRLGSMDQDEDDGEACAGIKPDQAKELDDFHKASCPGWIAARLEVPALAPRGKQASLLDAGRKEQVIQRLVPWTDWRRLLLGGTRSVPFAEFEMIGFPLRGPDDLLRALQSVAIGKGGAGGTVVMEVTTKQGVAP